MPSSNSQKRDLEEQSIRFQAGKAEREAKVLRLHGQGLTTGMIAKRLTMANQTVKAIILKAGKTPVMPCDAGDYYFGDAI